MEWMCGMTLKTAETLRLRLSDGLRRHHTFHNSLCLIEKKLEKNRVNESMRYSYSCYN